MDEIQDAIKQNVQGPAKVSSDAGSVEQHSIKEQIDADRYLSAKEEVAKRHRGLRFSKLRPPGAD